MRITPSGARYREQAGRAADPFYGCLTGTVKYLFPPGGRKKGGYIQALFCQVTENYFGTN